MLFCSYAFISKSIAWNQLYQSLAFQKSQHEVETAFWISAKIQTNFEQIWSIFFAILLLIWVLSLIRKSEKIKIYLVCFTLIGALGMSITDNIKTEVYISDIIVNGEMLENK